jgi:putative tricarboxylic transport membrane protein
MFVQSWQLPFYTSIGFGPGFFPLVLSVILSALGLGVVIQATFGRPELAPADFNPGAAGLLRLAGMVLATTALIFLLDPLGFRLVIFAYIFALVAIVGGLSWWFNASLSLAFSWGFAVVLRLLDAPLPVGWLGI